jgi:acyl-ACP thioesterase
MGRPTDWSLLSDLIYQTRVALVHNMKISIVKYCKYCNEKNTKPWIKSLNSRFCYLRARTERSNNDSY